MAQLGTGTTITFATSEFSAEILSVDGPSRSRESVQTSHMGSTDYHTFTPADLVDGGEVTIEIAHQSTTSPPIGGVAESITIDWGGNGDADVFTGFVTGYTPNAAIDERMTASMTVKVADEIS